MQSPFVTLISQGRDDNIDNTRGLNCDNGRRRREFPIMIQKVTEDNGTHANIEGGRVCLLLAFRNQIYPKNAANWSEIQF